MNKKKKMVNLHTYMAILNNYWTRLSRISWFVCGEQINYLPKPKAEANNWSARHSITEFIFLMNILGKRSDLPFSRKSDRKKEKSTVSFTHMQNIICSQTQLDGIAHEQTIICRQLFAGHVVSSRPMKRKKNLLGMIITNIKVDYSSASSIYYCT